MRRALLCACVVGLAAAQAQAQTSNPQVLRLTLEEAIQTARRFNPAYLQTLNDEGPADVAVSSAYSRLFLPQASVFGAAVFQDEGELRFSSFTFGRQPPVRISTYDIGLDYRFNGQTLLAPGQARAERRSVMERIHGAEIELRATVTRAYLEVLRLRDQAAQARLERDRTAQHLRLAQAREAVGAGTALETKQAEVALGQAEVALLQAENAARVAQLRLAQTLGILPPDSFDLGSQLEVFQPTWDAPSLVKMGLQVNPTLRSLQAAQDAARTGVRIARSSYLPTVNLSASWSGFTREASNVDAFVDQEIRSLENQFEACQFLNEPRAALNLSLLDCAQFQTTPDRVRDLREQIEVENDQFPFDFETQPRQIILAFSMPVSAPLQLLRPIPVLGKLAKLPDPDLALSVEQAEAVRKDAMQQVRALELQLRADITEAVYNLETAYRTVELQKINRERAQDELRLAQERYRLGAGTFLELLDSQTLARRAEVDSIDAVYGFHLALAALEAAVGRPFSRTPAQ